MGFRQLVGQGVRRVSSRTTQPADASEGDLWYDSDAVVPDTDAADVTFDDTGLDEIAGADVQAALESADAAIAGLSGAVGTATTKYKTADESLQNNTLQNDNHLNFAIAANEVWSATFHLYLSAVSAAADFQFACTVPAGATARHALIGGATGLGATEGDAHVQSHATVTSGMAAGAPAASNNDSYAIYSITVENSSNAGTVQLQWAQLVTTASNSTVKQGSFMIAHRLA